MNSRESGIVCAGGRGKESLLTVAWKKTSIVVPAFGRGTISFKRQSAVYDANLLRERKIKLQPGKRGA